MSIFSKKNQRFTTVDLVILIVLLGMAGSFTGTLLASGLQDQLATRAQSSADAFALQLLQRAKDQQFSSGVVASGGVGASNLERQPSSNVKSSLAESDVSSTPSSSPVPQFYEGRIGRDPWGRPFHYRFDSHANGRALARAVVWSEGPNRRPESSDAVAVWMNDQKDTALPPQPSFSGDDIGSYQEVTFLD